MRSLVVFVLALGCSPASEPPLAAADSDVAETTDAAEVADARIDKAAGCASAFGSELTSSFGRADGIVTAIVAPTVTTCALPNSDHVVLQMRMNGAVYRMVINVQSTRGADVRVRFATIEHAAIEPAWAEGWHTGFGLDYATHLGAHNTDASFVPHEMLPLSEQIESAIDLGKPVSVYAWSSGGGSAHKVHRNGSSGDGAIVIDPAGPKPKWLLFHFADQTF